MPCMPLSDVSTNVQVYISVCEIENEYIIHEYTYILRYMVHECIHHYCTGLAQASYTIYLVHYWDLITGTQKLSYNLYRAGTSSLHVEIIPILKELLQKSEALYKGNAEPVHGTPYTTRSGGLLSLARRATPSVSNDPIVSPCPSPLDDFTQLPVLNQKSLKIARLHSTATWWWIW